VARVRINSAVTSGSEISADNVILVEGAGERNASQTWAVALLDHVLLPLKPRHRRNIVKLTLAIQDAPVLRQGYTAALETNSAAAETLVNITVGIITSFAESEGPTMRALAFSSLLAGGERSDGQWPAALAASLKKDWDLPA
jgi:hypothetical protein